MAPTPLAFISVFFALLSSIYCLILVCYQDERWSWWNDLDWSKRVLVAILLLLDFLGMMTITALCLVSSTSPHVIDWTLEASWVHGLTIEIVILWRLDPARFRYYVLLAVSAIAIVVHILGFSAMRLQQEWGRFWMHTAAFLFQVSAAVATGLLYKRKNVLRKAPIRTNAFIGCFGLAAALSLCTPIIKDYEWFLLANVGIELVVILTIAFLQIIKIIRAYCGIDEEAKDDTKNGLPVPMELQQPLRAVQERFDPHNTDEIAKPYNQSLAAFMSQSYATIEEGRETMNMSESRHERR